MPKEVLASEDTLPSGLKKSEIGSIIEDYVEKNEKTTAGLAVSVFDENGVLYENYIGSEDKEKKLPVDEETVFEWGSVTKLMVWVSLMQLEEQGKVDFNTDIRTYLPKGYLGDLSYKTPITITHLFNHEAGFQDFIAGLFEKQGKEVLSLGDTLKLYQPPQIYEPGYTHGYSNWSTALGGYIVENISGMTFSDYVHENIMSPLDMKDTGLLPNLSDNASVKERRAHLKNYTTSGALMDDANFQISLYPAGMATGTLEDFRKFATQFLTGEEPSKLFQNQETLEKMQTPTKLYSGTDIGLNFHGMWSDMYQVQTMGHAGNTAGGSSNLLFDPQSKVGVVVMTNQGGESVYNKDMMELIFGKFSESQYADMVPKPVNGLFRWTRVIEEGPYKFYELTGYRPIGAGDISSFWQYTKVDGVDRIEQTHWNLLRVPTGEAAIVLVILISLVLGIVFAIGTIVASLVSMIRKKTNPLPNRKLRGMTALISLLQIGLLVNLVLLLMRLFSFAPSEEFKIFYIVFVLLAVALLVLGLTLFVKTMGEKKTMKGKWKYYLSSYLAIINVLFIIKWNLFMFWAL